MIVIYLFLSLVGWEYILFKLPKLLELVKYLKQFVLTTLIIFTIFFISPVTDVQAFLNAKSSYNVKVEVDSSGETWIEYDIHLENQSSSFYIRDYSLLCDHTDMIDLTVIENGKSADFRKEHGDDRVRIRVILERQLVSKGDQVDIHIGYKTRQLYKSEGLLRNLNIPPLQTEENLEEVNFTLTIPENFDEFSFISLKDAKFSKEAGKEILRYSQSDAPLGLFVVFGEEQQFEFVYNYNLYNESDKEKMYTITLPSDSPSQIVYFTNITLIPERTLSDNDGNNLIEYLLGPGESKDIRVTGFTRITRNTEKVLDTTTLQLYLKESEIWQFNDENVRNIINKVTRSDYSMYENAGFIYDYIIANFEYSEVQSSDRVNVTDLIQGDKQLSCENFTDLFVALARGSGIPTREVVGFSNLSDTLDSLHFWVEFYDDINREWVIADPCLEVISKYSQFDNLDFNRVVLAYRGVSDAEPNVIPPFSKFQNLGADNLELKASYYKYLKDEQVIDFHYKVGSPDLFFKSIPLKFYITNNSQSILRLESITVDDAEVELMSKHISENFNESVFPGQSSEISIKLSNLPDLSVERVENYNLGVLASFGSNIFNKNYEFDVSRPFSYYHAISWFISLLIAVITLAIFLLALKRIRTISWKRQPKYKYKFKKSKIGNVWDVPVSLR